MAVAKREIRRQINVDRADARLRVLHKACTRDAEKYLKQWSVEWNRLDKDERTELCHRWNFQYHYGLQLASAAGKFPEVKALLKSNKVDERFIPNTVTGIRILTGINKRSLVKLTKAGLFTGAEPSKRQLDAARRTGKVGLSVTRATAKQPPTIAETLGLIIERATGRLSGAQIELARVVRYMRDNELYSPKGTPIRELRRAFSSLCDEMAAADPDHYADMVNPSKRVLK
jgi:hypothetical protein